MSNHTNRRLPVSFLMRICALPALVLLLSACSDAPHVVLYVSADERFAREVAREFERETGIRIDLVTDTEMKKTTGLVERLRAEKDNPQADVFWSSEVFMTIELAEEGILAPFESPATQDWPKQHRDPDRRWYGFAARARVIVYAPDRVPADQRPATWMDLTKARFQGRIVMADPRFGTTGGHLGAMKAYWQHLGIPGYYEAFIEGLAENNVRLLTSGNAGVVEAVRRGEADLGLTDTDDVWVVKAQGGSVELIYAAHNVDSASGAGTLLIPNTVALVTGSRNPQAAAQLIDFLLSERVERLLAESDSRNVPLRPGLADSFPELAVPDPLRVSFEEAAKLRAAAVEQFMHALERTDESESVPPRDEEAARLEDEKLEPGYAP